MNIMRGHSVLVAGSAPSRNIRAQFEVLEIYFGFDIGFLHDFDHSSLRTTYRKCRATSHGRTGEPSASR